MDWEHWSSLPLNWDLHQQLLCFWGLGLTLRSTPWALEVSMLQVAGCGASQPPQSFKSVPYGMLPFCVSGDPWLILCVNRGKGQLPAMGNMTLLTWAHELNLVKYLKSVEAVSPSLLQLINSNAGTWASSFLLLQPLLEPRWLPLVQYSCHALLNFHCRKKGWYLLNRKERYLP